MSDRSLNSLTLRKKFIEVEKTARELADHLERGCIPRAHEVRRLAQRASQPDQQDEIKDVTIRSSAERLIQIDDYTRELCQKAEALLAGIEADVQAIFEHG
ncbi:MAG: hypothetical protein DWQ34_26375 [Planctomycetota bacterium]|nr:MAG: hypothetical protein DWQ29_16920 [Planctomycetota bacterium]REJ86811.1 MAG: hypothetical protein DWQ34_26375 [Planctomycetota bacterium]REK22751.1 MAG: hypothetical protein DWQ41_18280 [Planctomycetota bacterium]REK33829.1 MAG: hypothetical protein DWQ45_14710 [Planctomycetota bacterium]